MRECDLNTNHCLDQTTGGYSLKSFPSEKQTNKWRKNIDSHKYEVKEAGSSTSFAMLIVPICKNVASRYFAKNLVLTILFATSWSIWMTRIICKTVFFVAFSNRFTLQRLFVWPHRARLDPVCESTGSRRSVGGGALLVLVLLVDVTLALVQIQMGWHSLVLNGWCHSMRNSALM